MTPEDIQADIQQFLDRAATDEPELHAELMIEHWHPPCEIDANHPLATATVAAAREVLGEAPSFSAFPGGTDAPFFQLAAGIPTLPSFGPGLLTSAHRPNESISVESIENATALYAGIAQRFLDD